ncbi:MAG: hypothetical protein K2K45_00010 [Muribaculaceae bacterium]|nr:hypothetical protein [Muribaculaceae bacterium]MDE7097419.1 hypothetical protein [Muribaculaceae bacterium]
MKKIYASKPLALGALSLVSLFAFAKPEKYVQIFSNGEVIQQYAVSDIDYIEVNEISDLEEGSQYEYVVKDLDLNKSGSFSSGFFFKNTWDEGCTFNFSVSELNHYMQLGNSMNIELYLGSKELYSGKEFNVAETELPFSFKFQYVNASLGNTVDAVISNNSREGAEGTISVIPNARGSYDVVFDVTLNSGNESVKGYYAGEYKPRNTIYSSTEGTTGTVKGATLDLTGDTCVLYLTTKDGEAGPDNYDVKGEVPVEEWIYGKFMSFSGQGSTVEWSDGVVCNSASVSETGFFGGNWRVMEPVTTPAGSTVAECSSMLFGNSVRYLYYYGEIKIIE